MNCMYWVGRSKNIVVLRVADFVRIEADLGPLVPIRAAARLWGRSVQALRDRIRRGTLPVVQVYGEAFVPLSRQQGYGIGNHGRKGGDRQ